MAQRAVVVTPQFRSDLRAVVAWIAADNEPAAEGFTDAISVAIRRLRDGVAEGPRLSDDAPADLRRLLFGHFHNHYIAYRRDLDRVVVLRLIDARRDPAAILRDVSG